MASNENKNDHFYLQKKATLDEESEKGVCKNDEMTTDSSKSKYVIFSSVFSIISDFQSERKPQIIQNLPIAEDNFKLLDAFNKDLNTPMDVTDDNCGFIKGNLLTENPIDKGLEFLKKTTDDRANFINYVKDIVGNNYNLLDEKDTHGSQNSFAQTNTTFRDSIDTKHNTSKKTTTMVKSSNIVCLTIDEQECVSFQPEEKCSQNLIINRDNFNTEGIQVNRGHEDFDIPINTSKHSKVKKQFHRRRRGKTSHKGISTRTCTSEVKAQTAIPLMKRNFQKEAISATRSNTIECLVIDDDLPCDLQQSEKQRFRNSTTNPDKFITESVKDSDREHESIDTEINSSELSNVKKQISCLGGTTHNGVDTRTCTEQVESQTFFSPKKQFCLRWKETSEKTQSLNQTAVTKIKLHTDKISSTSSNSSIISHDYVPKDVPNTSNDEQNQETGET